jgi:hypothetical protein
MSPTYRSRVPRCQPVTGATVSTMNRGRTGAAGAARGMRWARRDSNPRLLPCKNTASPAGLTP